MTFLIRFYIAFYFVSFAAFSQVNEVNPPEYIKTIIFKGNTDLSQLPIVELGESIEISFDALNGDEEDYYYKIEHFNHDWTPSQLMKPEFLEGFDNQRIRNYENSYNTYQIYSHYTLTIPNQFTKSLKVTGNYIISIFNNDDELVFSRKFMIYENKANVGVTLKRSRDLAFINEKQRVEILIDPKITLTNPKQTVKAVIIKNNNLKTAITNIKPQFTVGTQLMYRYDKETSFWAGNEYLYFENKDTRAANTGVQYIELKNLYHSYLYTNTPRNNIPYTYFPDINGNYTVLNLDAKDSDIEADYVWVHFSLKATENLKNKAIYVYGNFNNFSIDNNTKMNYDANQNIFYKTLLLKQGFYNYKYVSQEKTTLNEGIVSGNFYQTENNYKVIVYYRNLGARYDQIIGLGEGTSVNISN
ncbi:type IX secretion system plug protein [Neotamlana laminarinivorans]|uniref:DUF5103 domain-containing protein n=1 Tax=Neotamlana laminarinivorans TaxID=2883124 RepID=A0A9X1I1B5_9FLAO|nr:DUF5103 domain-containing protein [Tamlana laminarinivorans]MCB4799615.1 DUF5103 domain-containing protein [Tamlana laminarinivorans]